MLPSELIRGLNIEVVDRLAFRLADQRVEEYDVGEPASDLTAASGPSWSSLDPKAPMLCSGQLPLSFSILEWTQ